jgi:hypothetical protein
MVANREIFLGLKTRRRRVLLLDYENPANIIKARNDDLGLDLPRNQNLKLWDRFGPMPTPRPDDPLLEEIVKECVVKTGHAPWIIFDSWASLLKSGEGGELTGQIAPIYLHLRKFADLGATITILDHSRKYDKNKIYGGPDKEAKADSIHNLSAFPDKLRPSNPIVRVESWLKRAAPQGEGTFAFEVRSEQDREGNWHIVDLVPAQDPEEAKSQQDIHLLRNLIRENPNSGQEALAKLAKDHEIPRDRATVGLRLASLKWDWMRRGWAGTRSSDSVRRGCVSAAAWRISTTSGRRINRKPCPSFTRTFTRICRYASMRLNESATDSSFQKPARLLYRMFRDCTKIVQQKMQRKLKRERELSWWT